ncbi:hypothetical protein AZF37_04910 [endosymbiont 'TC1' of Trimyema compressum]|uniref:CidA/LrgA family protein n=1 Tax=endosymbiont 'TC1' of Trimyema compressum TaxID=243899 RepID=UPI0007F04FF7|nr:CidA/LrgA family protein [endosymbiont 'TC1' of Trimyema compressum]AMP20599.1 hypothetical protein AZF37_04910 [endosymbiont 'TC1' of Trimyema compressum]
MFAKIKQFIIEYILPLLIVLLLLWLGELLAKFIPVLPGNLIGMFLLLILLQLKIIPYEFIKKFAKFFIRHISFFFVPAGVSILTTLGILGDYILQIVIVIEIGVLVVFVGVGKVVQWMTGKAGDGNE